jgi:hypothetical protein
MITKAASRPQTRNNILSVEGHGRSESYSGTPMRKVENETSDNLMRTSTFSPPKKMNENNNIKRDTSINGRDLLSRARESTSTQRGSTKSTITTHTSESLEKIKIITNFAFKTRAGSTSTKPQKINQDAYIVEMSILNQRNRSFCGVCDGHGIVQPRFILY